MLQLNDTLLWFLWLENQHVSITLYVTADRRMLPHAAWEWKSNCVVHPNIYKHTCRRYSHAPFTCKQSNLIRAACILLFMHRQCIVVGCLNSSRGIIALSWGGGEVLIGKAHSIASFPGSCCPHTRVWEQGMTLETPGNLTHYAPEWKLILE